MLLRGEGRYTDDLNLPGQLHAVMVRSRVAHGHLRGIDLSEAATMPGVLAIYTAADLQSAGIKPMAANVAGANHDGSPVPKPTQYALATDKVRYVGDPIAVVVAETAKQAKDAAEMVFADIDGLPAVTDAAAAARPRCPATLRRGARQPAHGLAVRRRRPGRCRLRPRRPCHRVADSQQSHRGLRDGAAFGDRRVRRRDGPLHLPRGLPGRVRPAQRPVQCHGRAHREDAWCSPAMSAGPSA